MKFFKSAFEINWPLVSVKLTMKISSIFLAFLENMNFIMVVVWIELQYSSKQRMWIQTQFFCKGTSDLKACLDFCITCKKLQFFFVLFSCPNLSWDAIVVSLNILERLLDFSQHYVIKEKWTGKFNFHKLLAWWYE